MNIEKIIAANKARATHGMSKSRTYRQWMGMKSRCNNPSDSRYKRYGGRGVAVCPRWLESFSNFYADMGDCPDGYSLDRIDNDKGYEPGNCRWATPMEQANNRGTNVFIEHEGNTLSLAQWARVLGLPYHWLVMRNRAGYKPPELFSRERLPTKVGRTFDYQGEQLPMKEISKRSGVKLQTLYARLYAGKPLT